MTVLEALKAGQPVAGLRCRETGNAMAGTTGTVIWFEDHWAIRWDTKETMGDILTTSVTHGAVLLEGEGASSCGA